MQTFQVHRLGTCAVIEKQTQNIIGVCALKRLHHEGADHIETMYRFSRSSWGKGYATEAALTYFRYGFETLNIDEIIGIIDVRNDASRKVLQKLKMNFLRNSTFQGYPVEIYVIRKKDWHVYESANSP
jgi:[ribosomal protein S5]-alanine N-acetyltransferase